MLCNRDLLRNEEKSIHHLVSVCEKHPSYCYGHYLLGEEYLHRGDASSALQSFQNALREDDSDYRVWLGLGDCHYLRKDNRTAAAHYCQALTIFPGCMNAYCRLARAWIQAGNLENAHQTVNKGLSIDKNCMGVNVAVCVWSSYCSSKRSSWRETNNTKRRSTAMRRCERGAVSRSRCISIWLSVITKSGIFLKANEFSFWRARSIHRTNKWWPY